MRCSALFLDRDGVINIDRGYVARPADFIFIDGVGELCLTARNFGYIIVIVTNQAGIGRSYFSEEQMHSLHVWMCKRLVENNVVVDAIYHCPFHPDAIIKRYRCDSFDRKPNPGMLLRAAADLEIDMGSSVLIGDKLTDIEAGKRAGVKVLFLFDQTLPADPTPTSFGYQSGSLCAIADFLLHTAPYFYKSTAYNDDHIFNNMTPDV
jgi:D-glycero-D-manno-heptose 1,7-bisphosphate phosphatase